MSLILSIETSSKNCSVSLSKDGSLLDLVEENNESFSHAENLHIFCEKCSPHSAASIIVKAAERRNHENTAFSGPPVNRVSTIFTPFIAPSSKTLANTEHAHETLLPTDHDASLHQKCKLQDAPVIILML